jgi:hypothetical protein
MTSTNNEETVCYLCLDGGIGQPLRRDCACRGTDAGFVHLTCLAGYAEIKCVQASEMNEFREPWERCPNCHQDYQGELAIDIANKFVSFVRRQYPDNTQMQVEALNAKLGALGSMFGRLTAEQKRELGGVTANVLLSLIERMKNDEPPLHPRYYQFEANAYQLHGEIALDEGTEESAKRAVTHFEKSLQVFEAVSDADGVATAKRNIAIARSKYDDGNYNEELMRASQELYELRIAEYGEEHYYTINAGKNYADILQKSNRREESRELLTKLWATSKQVFGPDHNTTKKVESALRNYETLFT